MAEFFLSAITAISGIYVYAGVIERVAEKSFNRLNRRLLGAARQTLLLFAWFCFLSFVLANEIKKGELNEADRNNLSKASDKKVAALHSLLAS